jgi:hypothetical protein
MRKIVPIIAVLGVAGVFGITAGSASAPFAKPTKQQMAQRVLDRAILTSSAHAFFAAMARGDQRLTSDAPTTKQQGRPTPNGNKPGGSGLTNVRVNNPGEDTHQTEQTTQSETSVAVSGSNVAVGFNDSQTTLLFLTPASDLSGYAYSSDGGSTFTDGGALPNNAPTINFGDPWLASSNGTMYYSNLVDDPFVGLLVGVATSTNGGQTWTTPSELPVPAQGPNSFFGGADKDALTASGSSLYDSWDDFTFTFDPTTGSFLVQSGLTMASSTNAGQSWSAVYADQVPVFDSNNPCIYHQYIGAQPLVGNDGTIYDFALRFDLNDPVAGDPYPCANAQPETESEVVAVSHDGGATFSKPTTIANVVSSTGNFGAFVLGPGQYMRNLEFPTVAQQGGTLYVAWNDGASGQSHIMLSKSSDNGATWSSPSAVTSGSNNEAQPAISADGSGVHILYYEISPSGPGTSQLDTVVADSKNGGHSWSMTRVTSQSFPGVYTLPQFDPIIAFAYMGDYIANVSDGNHQYFAWGDNRDVVNNFLWPQGRHDPDVFFARH